jgi:hypothetical protein
VLRRRNEFRSTGAFRLRGSDAQDSKSLRGSHTTDTTIHHLVLPIFD